jgi:hypothetical protein
MSRSRTGGATLLTALALGCATTTPPPQHPESEPQEGGEAESESAPGEAEEARPPAGPIADRGNFRVVYQPSKKLKGLAVAVKEAKALAHLVPKLNESFALPKDLPVLFADCGTPNAFYDPERVQITICYEFVQYMAEGFAKVTAPGFDADEALTNALTFMFFHELGHALVHIFDLPITGREEDSVDQLATVMLLDLDGGDLMAIHGANAFKLMGSDELDVKDLPYWDVHSLNEQRYYNVLCWVYGRDPGASLRAAVAGAGMPDSRLDQCPEEANKMTRSWNLFLQAFTKGEASN